MKTRPATLADADAISDVLDEIFRVGKRASAGDAAMVREFYIEDPDRVCCTVMEADDGCVLGFQSLKLVRAGNIYNAPVGWGVIGTHIRPSAARLGIGKRLFAVSLKAAQEAGLKDIEAQIGADNGEALAFYEAMGFHTYRYEDTNMCKQFKVG
ncbi:GNAT family N-acetyltransferase [Cohaesibacter sp. CAU 1516]|uniref:GNAT family N-acetyltransferase n=1 Tax=Cohaesibacter sp. CAU 1516 TaxID=2576038 RepID=UPI0010FE53FA|nr:GNAT family N-acetyltransferase [Cohaesibacter sp. CAU 1516]TLP48130.1 GNAT family N-acetyltransferase [Cohaesibacter sp. CAU 1516]